MENPTWGAPRIHGELLKLGFVASEPTVSRCLRRVKRNPDPAQRWLTFLRNHREAIAAMDFFTVPTLTFGFLYCFFISVQDSSLQRDAKSQRPLDCPADARGVALHVGSAILALRPRCELWQGCGLSSKRDGECTRTHGLS